MKNVLNKKKTKDRFDIEESPISKVYILLNTNHPKDLYNKYLEKDQELVKRGELNYESSKFITTKIKNILEKISPIKLSKEERHERKQILWLWHHHAISYAIWKYKDKEKAKKYASQALGYQPKDHPNHITRLLYFLVHDQLTKAEQWLKNMRAGVEKTTARKLVKFYKEGGFFGKPK